MPGELTSLYAANKAVTEHQTLMDWLNRTAIPPMELQPGHKVGETPEHPAATPKPQKTAIQAAQETPAGRLAAAIGEELLAVPEAAASLVGGTVTPIVSKVAGTIALPFVGADRAQQFEDWMNQTFIYQPYTGEAKAAVAKVGKVFEPLGIPGHYLGELSKWATGNEDLAYGMRNVGDLATLILVGKAVGGVKEGVKSALDKRAIGKQKIPPEEGAAPAKPVRKAEEPGDAQAIMDRLADEAHAELDAALKAIPKEEFDKLWQEDKPVEIGDLAQKLEEFAKRGEGKGTELEKLPAHYKEADRATRQAERADLEQRAARLKEIADEAKAQGVNAMILPGKVEPKPGEIEIAPGRMGTGPRISAKTREKWLKGADAKAEESIEGGEKIVPIDLAYERMKKGLVNIIEDIKSGGVEEAAKNNVLKGYELFERDPEQGAKWLVANEKSVLPIIESNGLNREPIDLAARYVLEKGIKQEGIDFEGRAKKILMSSPNRLRVVRSAKKWLGKTLGNEKGSVEFDPAEIKKAYDELKAESGFSFVPFAPSRQR